MPQRRTPRTRPTAPRAAGAQKNASARASSHTPRAARGASRPSRSHDSAPSGRTVRVRKGAAPHRRAAEVPAREITLPGGRELTLTRRHFLYGVAGVTALALMGAGAAYGASQSRDSDGTATLSVPESSVVSSNDFESVKDADAPVVANTTIKLPYGSLVWACDDDIAACLLPTETGKPLVEMGLLNLKSGKCVTVLEHAIAEEEGFEIYDVRANAAGAIWTEADILDGVWRVYAAARSKKGLGEAKLLDEGDVNWEMPTLACSGDYGYWQRLPQLDGNARVEDSLLKRAAFGTDAAEVVYESQGRMACAPTSCGDAIIATPRARTSGTYYQMTRIDGTTGAVTDACVLPSSMKPMECSWAPNGFTFVFDGIYSYGDGIANLGTYLPYEPIANALASDEKTENASTDAQHSVSIEAVNPATRAYSQVPWFHFAREPRSAPSWCGNWLMIRSQTNLCAIDLAGRRVFPLAAENGANDYGDFLASTHLGKRAVSFSNIDYTPIGGEQEKYCLVKVWEEA